MGDYDVGSFLTSFLAAYDGAALAATLGVAAAVSWAKYLASSSALRRVRAAPFAPISDLRSLLQDDDRLVVVRGRVQPDPGAAGIVSAHSDALAVLVKRTEKCLYNETWGLFRRNYNFQFIQALLPDKKNETCSGSLRSVPFVLVGGGQQPHSAYVHVCLGRSTQQLPLTMVYSHMCPVQSPWYSFIWVLFGHSYPVATLSDESILPIGKEISAVGICRSRDGGLEINPCMQLPYFLSDMTKDQIEADLTNNTKFLFWSSVVLGTFSIGILSYAIVRNWQTVKGFWNGNLTNELSDEEQPETENEDSKDIPDGELCVVCVTRRRVHAFLPCGHRLCCPSCARYVKTESSSPKCPVCRQLVRSSLRIYNS